MPETVKTPAPVENVFYLDLDSIEVNPFQPRLYFDPAELEDLANSIRANTLLQPILVRPIAGKEARGVFYQLVDGERRWRALQMLKRKQIAATVREMSDEQVMIAALVANDQRVGLTDYEKSQQFIRIAQHGEQVGVALPQRELARRMGRSLSFVRNRLLLPTLHEDVVDVAKRRSDVTSSLFLVNELPKTERAPILAQIDREAPASFRTVKQQVEQARERMKTVQESRRAPDAETAQRSATHARTGGGNVSRGRQVQGVSPREAQQQIDALLSRIGSDIVSLENWLEAAPSVRNRNLGKIEELAVFLRGLTTDQ